MAHFAEINENNIVVQVLVVPDNVEHRGSDYLSNEIGLGGNWIQTSYNSKIRGTYAGPGYSYNKEEDIFVVPQPYPSWIRNGSFWEAPTPMPIDDKFYTWDEATTSWVEVPTL